jgi:hypothetical protein
MTIIRIFVLLAFSALCIGCASHGTHRTAQVKMKGAQSHGTYFEGSY